MELIWNLGWMAIYISGFFGIFIVPIIVIYERWKKQNDEKLLKWYERQKNEKKDL